MENETAKADVRASLPIAAEMLVRDLRDLMTTALESGGIGYWARVRDVRREEDLTVVSFEVIAKDAESPDAWKRIDAEGMARAVGWVLSRRVKVRADLVGQIAADHGAADADCADLLVQVAAFGDIVYG